MKVSSKSKTFEEQSHFGDLIQFVIDNLDTEEREVMYSGASPSMDIVVETKFKYKITLSKIECTHEKEVMRQGDGFVYVTCGTCGKSLD